MQAGLPIELGLPDRTPSDLRTYFMGEFAVILAVKGVLVDYQTLEQLADIAIGDV